MKISVIVPVYNEKNSVIKTLQKINQQKKNYNLEIIVVDDKSTDGTLQILRENSNLYTKLIENIKNLGKGGSLINGFQQSNGDIILIQDADLEYDPSDYKYLLAPFEEIDADVVYGSRFAGPGPRRVIYYTHQIANKFLTMLCNILLNRNFTDIETGYKVFKRSVINSLELTRNDFGIEIEITMKLAKMNCSMYEVGIKYYGRSYSEGKKIKFKDGLIALYLLFYFFFKK